MADNPNAPSYNTQDQPKDYATLEVPTDPNVKDYVTPESTVSGQLESLLKTDHPLAKQGQARALEGMNTKGLASSTMSIGAEQGAREREMLKIATPDAQSNSALQQAKLKSDLYSKTIVEEANVSNFLEKEKAGYQSTLQKEEAGHKSNLQKEQGVIDLARQKDQQASDMDRLAFDRDTQTQLETMRESFDKSLTEMKLSGDMYNLALSAGGQVIQNTETLISEMLSDPTLLDANDPQALTNAINSVVSNGAASLKFLGAAAGAESEFNTWANTWASSVWVESNSVVATTAA